MINQYTTDEQKNGSHVNNLLPTHVPGGQCFVHGTKDVKIISPMCSALLCMLAEGDYERKREYQHAQKLVNGLFSGNAKMNLIYRPNSAQAYHHHLQTHHHQSQFLPRIPPQSLPCLSMYLSLQRPLFHFQTTAFQ